MCVQTDFDWPKMSRNIMLLYKIQTSDFQMDPLLTTCYIAQNGMIVQICLRKVGGIFFSSY